MDSQKDVIVMSTLVSNSLCTVLRMEKRKIHDIDKNGLMHIAKGNHQGIVIAKPGTMLAPSPLDNQREQLSLSFKVFLVNNNINVHTQESRNMRFWLAETLTNETKMFQTQQFFRDLISPNDFPRDYVGFIKKIMKLMQEKYLDILKIEMEIKQLQDSSRLLLRPISVDENSLGISTKVTQLLVLEIIESSYPNAVSLSDISKVIKAKEEDIMYHLTDLLSKQLIKAMENNCYIRVNQNDLQVKVVQQMPKVNSSLQPTIAIITAQYYEKLAVDAMIENKDTYVRYKTEGESNVYTLGTIGWHRVVSTKLPAVGHSRGAMIAAGNTTTRLLGTFQKVEYVFLVGVGGAVPHYTDFSKHIRLGDVILSTPSMQTNKPFIYIHFDQIYTSLNGDSNSSNDHSSLNNLTYKTWCPPNLKLQELAKTLWKNGLENEEKRTWERYILNGLENLKNQESDFNRPVSETDKLYMMIGEKDVIEMAHPEAPENVYDPRKKGMPMIHFGSVGSGQNIVKDEHKRQDVSEKFNICAFDSEFDSVVESIYGNRKDRYIFIRGICDYKDGTRKKEWQPYAALAAAAYMKSMILALPPLN